MYRSTISLHQSQTPQRQLRSGRDISRHGSCGTISALLQRPCQPYFLLLHCVEADVIFPNCGSLTQWRCASAARTGLVSTSMSPDHGTPGNGLLLFFGVDDFDLALQRTRSLVSRLEEEPHLNSNTRTKEFRSEIRTDITLRSVRSGAKMRTICNADCSRSSHELGATEMDRPGDHWRSPDRAQGVYKHEAKEHDLPLVRQGRA